MRLRNYTPIMYGESEDENDYQSEIESCEVLVPMADGLSHMDSCFFRLRCSGSNSVRVSLSSYRRCCHCVTFNALTPADLISYI